MIIAYLITSQGEIIRPYELPARPDLVDEFAGTPIGAALSDAMNEAIAVAFDNWIEAARAAFAALVEPMQAVVNAAREAFGAMVATVNEVVMPAVRAFWRSLPPRVRFWIKHRWRAKQWKVTGNPRARPRYLRWRPIRP